MESFDCLSTRAGVELPDKLSDLIERAISDYNGLDRDLYYPISDQWHENRRIGGTDYCCVCLAGAVMAGSYKALRELRYAPSDYLGDVKGKLIALDKIRAGLVGAAIRQLGVDKCDMTDEQLELVCLFEVEVARGDWDNVKSWSGWDELADAQSHLAGLAARLRAVGL